MYLCTAEKLKPVEFVTKIANGSVGFGNKSVVYGVSGGTKDGEDAVAVTCTGYPVASSSGE